MQVQKVYSLWSSLRHYFSTTIWTCLSAQYKACS